MDSLASNNMTNISLEDLINPD